MERGSTRVRNQCIFIRRLLRSSYEEKLQCKGSLKGSQRTSRGEWSHIDRSLWRAARRSAVELLGFGESSIDFREQLSTCFSFAVRGRTSIMRLGAPPDSATPRSRGVASEAFPERTTEGFEGLRTSLSYGTLTPRQRNLDPSPVLGGMAHFCQTSHGWRKPPGALGAEKRVMKFCALRER